MANPVISWFLGRVPPMGPQGGSQKKLITVESAGSSATLTFNMPAGSVRADAVLAATVYAGSATSPALLDKLANSTIVPVVSPNGAVTVAMKTNDASNYPAGTATLRVAVVS